MDDTQLRNLRNLLHVAYPERRISMGRDYICEAKDLLEALDQALARRAEVKAQGRQPGLSITLCPTAEVVPAKGGGELRVWCGETNAHTQVHAFIAAIAVVNGEDDQDLQDGLMDATDPCAQPWIPNLLDRLGPG